MVERVRIGFVVEGETEKKFAECTTFREWAIQHGMEICDPIINIEGKSKIFNKEILNQKIADCRNQAAPDKVVLLFDLDNAPCYTTVRDKIDAGTIDLIVIAKKSVEAWFLADSEAMSTWLGRPFHEDDPECTRDMPWDAIKSLRDRNGRGPGEDHLNFTKRIIRAGFSIQRAAEHPCCPSARYFIEKLHQLREPTP